MANPELKMILQIGSNLPPSNSRVRPHDGLTLIELICIMALVAVVVSLTAPSLAHFFRGRSLDSEARRFLALTRYGQSRAVAEGVPMVLWLDQELGAYGLKAEVTYEEQDEKAVEFELPPDLQMELELPATGLESVPWKVTTEVAGNRPSIRFTPDGFIGDYSPTRIVFRQIHEGENDEIWIGLSRNRLNYEIQTNAIETWAVR